MTNRVELELWFKAEEVPKNFLGKLPKKYRDVYKEDSSGVVCKKHLTGFRFTEFALFTALDVLECEPSDFDKNDEEERLKAISYGAAVYDCVKTGKPVFFTYEEFKKAIERGRIEQFKELGKAWANASYPQWIRESLYEEDETNRKKK
ncbi:MAG: hypothetical protein R6U65_08485 [Perlabentimonas sp.]